MRFQRLNGIPAVIAVLGGLACSIEQEIRSGKRNW